jgi:hypothetical protein
MWYQEDEIRNIQKGELQMHTKTLCLISPDLMAKILWLGHTR